MKFNLLARLWLCVDELWVFIFCLAIEHPFIHIFNARGNRRFRKLYDAAWQGETTPPSDLRYLSKPRATDRNHEVRADVVGFLADLYNSCAETLPDVRDDPLTAEEELSLSEPTKAEPESDPYAKTMADVISGRQDLLGVKGRKRKKRRGVEINPARSNMEPKWLPPGCMRDHWEQYRLVSHLPQPASFPTFWRATWRWTKGAEITIHLFTDQFCCRALLVACLNPRKVFL